MAGEPGIEVPFSIGADGAVVTLETLAAKVLELEDAVKKAGKATEDAIGQKTSLKAKVLDGVFFSIGNTVTNKVIGAVERLSSIVTGLPSVFADLVQTGDKLADMALQFNTTAESLQQLEAAGVPVGVTMEQIVRSMNLVDRTMSSSGEKFRKYGLDVDSLAKLDTAQRFEAIATKLHAIEDPAKQAAASFELLKDRSGAMLKIIRQAPEEFAKSRKELEDYGLIISGKTVAALDEFGEKQQKLGKVWEGVQQNLVAVVAESKPLQEALQVSIELIGSLSKWVADNQKELLDWVNFGVLYAVEALTMMTRALPIVIDAFSGMRVMLSVVKTGFDGITASVSFAVDAFMLLNEIQTKGLTESADAAKRLKERVSDFAVEMSNLSVKGNAEIRKINKQNAELQDGADVVLSKAEKLRRRIVDSSKNADFALPGQKKSAGETGPSQEDLTRQTKYLENAQKIASIEAQVSGILASRSGGQAVADASLAAAE